MATSTEATSASTTSTPICGQTLTSDLTLDSSMSFTCDPTLASNSTPTSLSTFTDIESTPSTVQTPVKVAVHQVQRKNQKKVNGGGRMRWTNSMSAELLRLRFADGEVKRRLETADTKIKKALAWQLFASIDEGLWFILSDAFASRGALSEDILMDSNLEDDDENGGADSTETTPTKANQKAPPVAQLATALQSGMEAIAASMGTRAKSDDPIHALTRVLQQQHQESRRLQDLQLQLLQRLLERQDN
ncbi:hypothetical protein BBJ28_00024338 [Nothophytophthora sp. Chile5]|nr:hypothetical protein BBJ28_00024338 [Nothophytophthora sp. Chile5]